MYNQARLLTPLGIDTKEIPVYPEIEISNEHVSDKIIKIVIHIGAKKNSKLSSLPVFFWIWLL